MRAFFTEIPAGTGRAVGDGEADAIPVTATRVVATTPQRATSAPTRALVDVGTFKRNLRPFQGWGLDDNSCSTATHLSSNEVEHQWPTHGLGKLSLLRAAPSSLVDQRAA